MSTNTQPELKLRSLWLSIGYALVALVVYLSLTSSPVDPGLDFPMVDKVYHAFAYFVLMAWFAQIYHGRFQRNLIAVIFIVMGISLEALQSFDPNRYFEFADMVANTAGVISGLLLTLTAAKNCLLKFEQVIP